MGNVLRPLAGLVLALALLTSGAAAQGLPGGATSLNETHGDWTVACTTHEDIARCALTQTQVNGQDGQRVLAVQLTAGQDGEAVNGVLVLPFGLRLDSGVRIALDEAAPREPLRFSTCLPAGCLVPLAFDAATVTAFRAGTALSVTVIANDSGQEAVFSISLSGFTSALNRIAELNGT